MKKTYPIIILSIVVLSFSAMLIIKAKAQTRNSALQRAYQAMCASCHGRQFETFYKDEWHFGNGIPDIAHTITNGNAELGMPAFGQVMQKSAIQSLAEMIHTTVNSIPKPVKEFIPPYKKHVTGAATFTIDTVISNIGIPWGMTWLPDSSLLVTERDGIAYIVKDGFKSNSIKGLPPILVKGQGGLMDVELHPNYKENGWIYFSFSKPDDQNKKVGNTAIMRARLKDLELTDQEIIFEAEPKSGKGQHWGCRLEFDNDGYLYFSVGDRGQRDDFPQKLDTDCGKIHRIYDDGRIPKSNPFFKEDGAKASIFSYGHRNPQGIALHPKTGEIWAHEHGPKGGDELNIINKGRNYGWPVISYGINYNGTTFTTDTVKRGMEQPIMFWRPSIAPCGMTFVTGNKFPGWENNILVGSLSFKYLERVVLDGDKKLYTEKLLSDIGRVRNVKMGPDGYVYVAIEKPGKIIRLVPID